MHVHHRALGCRSVRHGRASGFADENAGAQTWGRCSRDWGCDHGWCDTPKGPLRPSVEIVGELLTMYGSPPSDASEAGGVPIKKDWDCGDVPKPGIRMGIVPLEGSKATPGLPGARPFANVVSSERWAWLRRGSPLSPLGCRGI